MGWAVNTSIHGRDLGLDTAMGLCRRLKIWKERMKKGLQRLSGTTRLTRATKKSRRLVNTGARPQFVWGQQGQGTTPSVLKQVRGRPVRGLGYVPKYGCTTA
eukprot:4316321-Pyramimonas_sp.AAC.1